GGYRLLFRAAGAGQGPRSARLGIHLLDLRGNIDPPLRGVLLAQAFADEQFRESLDARRTGRRVLRRGERLREVRLDVVPLRRSLIVRELDDDSVGLRHPPSENPPGP